MDEELKATNYWWTNSALEAAAKLIPQDHAKEDPWVWRTLDRKVSVPEFIEGRARGRMRLFNGEVQEHIQISWQEYEVIMSVMMMERMKAANDLMVDMMNDKLYGDDKK